MKLSGPALLLLLSVPCLASVSIRSTTLPNGTVGTAYSATVQASGGCTPYKWAISAGALPAGITATPSANSKSLKLSGTPTTAESSSFNVEVTGCGGRASQASYTVEIQDNGNGTGNYSVDLSWQASTSNDVAGYNVYRSPDASTWVKINSSLIALTDYSDSTIAENTTYYYAATAVDTSGNESAKTAPVMVNIP